MLYSRFFFFKIYLFNLCIFSCVGSSLLRAGFLQLPGAGATLAVCGLLIEVASLGCGARALGARASELWHVGSVVVARA